MSQSRLEKLGTIFSRVTALLRGGVMPREDKPLWYDVYHVFPPKTEPSYANRRPMPEIQEILYPEDSIRAKFHRRVLKRLPMGDLLKEPTHDLTIRAIDLVQELLRKDSSLNEDQAVDKVIEKFKKEGAIRTGRYESQTDAGFKNPPPEPDSDHQGGYQRPVKTITDLNIDVSKFLK